MKRRTLHFSFSLMAICLAVASCPGCGGIAEDQMTVYSVRGQVLVDGAPASGASISFIGMDENLKQSNAPVPKGTVGSDGSFSLSSYTKFDGAPAGKYRVIVIWEGEAPEDIDPESYEPVDKLEGKYDHANSELEVTIPEESTELPPFEL